MCHPRAAPIATSVESLSPTMKMLERSASFFSATSAIESCGFPTTIALHPEAVSTEARIAPAPGHVPSAAGKEGSSFVAYSLAPDMSAWVAVLIAS